MRINEKGFWENPNDTGHIYDENLSNCLINFCKENQIETLVDFGCGMGDYVKKLIKNNFICEAYDGNPNTEVLTDGIGKTLDLSEEINLNKKFDCVLSLEVGEHIPQIYEHNFVKNICSHTKKFLIISWAIEGQAGNGHINCKNNDYIINIIEKYNFKYNQSWSQKLRDCASNAWWFRNTIMVFIKNDN
jgi:hypothetical protein